MMRSMFAAISGLKNHQTMMDVVGNNIANVNTTGFKQSRVNFQDILSQTVRGASGPNGGRGGVNAEQIGLGVVLGGIDTIQTQGTLQSTGKSTDMAIQGDGYFVMSDGKQNYFTRDGSFDLGTDGTLVNAASGLHVMGWQANTLGVINSNVAATALTVPIGAGMTGKASTTLIGSGNLDANNAGGALNAVTLPTTVFDSLGNAQQVTLTAVKTVGANIWTVTPTATLPVPAGFVVAAAPTILTFDPSGKLVPLAATPAVPAITGAKTVGLTMTNGAGSPQTIALDLSAITQLAGTSSLDPATTDGSMAGSLTSFTVGAAGDITGVYSNGFKQLLGQMALGSFSNPGGLVKAGGNLFQASANSGNPNIGTPATGSRGTIATGFLEGSNVDLAQQFTNMIMAERGFQANSKVITTSDEILQDLVNLKH